MDAPGMRGCVKDCAQNEHICALSLGFHRTCNAVDGASEQQTLSGYLPCGFKRQCVLAELHSIGVGCQGYVHTVVNEQQCPAAHNIFEAQCQSV